MQTLRIFEAFAGLGAQIKALKKLGNEKGFHVESVGSIEWGINQIISYQILNFGHLKPEKNFTKEQLIEKLTPYTFSFDTKNEIKVNYFNSLSEEKLQRMFPYLYSFVNPLYFRKVYKKSPPNNHTDIKKFTQLPENIDIFTYSFPCVGFSQAGPQQGFDNPQSQLIYEVQRILESNLDKLPKVLILENVPALVGPKFLGDFERWVEFLSTLGYHTTWEVINSANLGSAQNRKRVYAVSILKSVSSEPFKFKDVKQKEIFLEDILDSNLDYRNYNHLLTKHPLGKFTTSFNNITSTRLSNNFSNFNSYAQVFLAQGKGPTLTAQGTNSDLKFYFPKQNTLRIISPKEAFVYMGFDQEDFNLIEQSDLITETQMKLLAGNSISIQALYSIFSNIFDYLNKHNYWLLPHHYKTQSQRKKLSLYELIDIERHKFITTKKLRFYKETIRKYCQNKEIYEPKKWMKIIHSNFKKEGIYSSLFKASRALWDKNFLDRPYYKLGPNGLFIPINLNVLYQWLTKIYFFDLIPQLQTQLTKGEQNDPIQKQNVLY
ncbi:CpG cytosine-specific DNA modification methyltransferase [Mycoplasmopsis citelli]|uniref:Cytosine-specific methyltransferase n=1 Tax=Mycoplasmopsis citelli TaxID=171281 RepID=A0A449B0U9_9BACT|nr:DNA (cytosine-5-)-methyltransferase [Mycoplasmopsis citelli]VEU74183.1 CpG cytosine-specific DNA modification methyltransferase [Mycoplasmopsis citelli]